MMFSLQRALNYPRHFAVYPFYLKALESGGQLPKLVIKGNGPRCVISVPDSVFLLKGILPSNPLHFFLLYTFTK